YQEVQINLSLHIQRSRPKNRRMQPGKRLRRGHIVAKKMVRRARPTQSRKRPPLRTLPFRQRDKPLTQKRNCRFSISLRAKLRAMRDGPGIDLSEVVIIDQLSQRLAPVV